MTQDVIAPPQQNEFAQLMSQDYVVPVEKYTGGAPVVDKALLEHVEFLVLDWRANESDEYGGIFYSVHIALREPLQIVGVTGKTEMHDHVIFNDGGVGIGPVLEQHLAATLLRRGLWARHGLRLSEYAANATRPAGSTWYFA